MNKEPLKVLLITPEEQTDFIINEIPKHWNIVVANSLEGTNERIDMSTAIIMIDDRIIQTNLHDVFNSIERKNKQTQIILLLHEFENIDAINLFNEGVIDKVLHSTSTNIKEILESTARQYIMKMEQNKNRELIKSSIENSGQGFISEDQLLDLSLMLTDTEIKDFTNQFVSIIRGIQSFISLNYSIYCDSRSEKHKKSMFKYLSDLELLANQYDQRILIVYVELVKSYIYLSLSNIEDAMFHYKSAVRVFYWISNEYIDPNIVDSINNFPVMEDEYYYIKKGEKEFVYDEEMEALVTGKLNILLKHDIQKLTNLSKSLTQFLRVDTDILSAVLVVRESLPLFIFENSEKSMDPALISGFVDAFSSFLQELTEGKGDIDHIQHDKGVLLIHRENNIKFLILAENDEVYLRIGLRQFAKDTLELFENVPYHSQVNALEEKLLVEKINSLFKLKLKNRIEENSLNK